MNSLVKYYIFLVFSFLYLNGNSQILKGIDKWETKSISIGKDATVYIKADVINGWHLYSQYIASDGPIPTTFTFKPSKNYKLVGKTIEPGGEEYYDPLFDMKIKFFDKPVEFQQKITLLTDKEFKLKGNVEFMVCNDKQCLPPDLFDFEVKIIPDPSVVIPVTNKDTMEEFIETTADTSTVNTTTTVNSLPDTAAIIMETGCGDWTSGEFVTDKSFWGIFIAGFIGGLLALLTPCVFPMIPMTVSFFTKRSGSRKKGMTNAIIYALSIIVIYVSLGFLVTITLGSDALNDLATNGYFNMAFFIIFIVFAFSFFGAFEIVLPNWLVNKADAASDRGGLIGIFFMAFTLSLVSFSCTGPIIGTLLVEAAHGKSYLGPVAGMTGFAIALALPFALFAAFPGWLNTIPKSGGWLNSVKVCLGFIELALALKFLSNVDLAYHWEFLKREMFIALWVIIFGLMGIYLLGKIKFSHDSDLGHIGVPRFLFSVLTLSFTIYMLPGLWGAPVKLLSGILPPEFYKEWQEKGSSDCPHDLNCFHDYDEGMAFAKTQGKPVIIDFTGYNCANCRKMEDYVWSDPKVLHRLSDQFVLISLYVDDKEELPAEQQYKSTFSGRRIVTKGNKWSDMQALRYNGNTQPMYVLIDNREKLLTKTWNGYDADISKYVNFLDEGLCRYTKRNTR